jgi:hypothetical protein
VGSMYADFNIDRSRQDAGATSFAGLTGGLAVVKTGRESLDCGLASKAGCGGYIGRDSAEAHVERLELEFDGFDCFFGA